VINGNLTKEKTEADLEEVLSRFSQLCKIRYDVIGNHCLSLPREYLLEKLEMKSSYYDFVIQKWRFIVLDSSQLSLFGNLPTSPAYISAEKFLKDHPVESYSNALSWNGGIGDEQFDWLNSRLSKTKAQGQRAIVFCHHPISAAASPSYLLWESEKVLHLLEKSQVVVAYFSGHFHPGGYVLLNQIHHITLPAMVSAPETSNAYAEVDVYHDKLIIHGNGMVESRVCDCFHTPK